MASAPYIGRFAPSPSGPLHAGSVVAALASWLDARAHDGRWLLRIEDIDPPRVEPGSDIRIRQQLRFLGLHWDAPPWYQSARVDRYQAAFDRLMQDGRIYGCACTRKEIAQAWAAYRRSLEDAQKTRLADCTHHTANEGSIPVFPHEPCRKTEPPCPASAPAATGQYRVTADESTSSHTSKPEGSPAISNMPAAAPPTTHEETPYLGTCRHGIPADRTARAWRFRVDAGNVDFDDRWLGMQTQTPASDCGDFILRRADGVWAYQLAVVVDDMEAGISHIVRGADLLSSTGRQMQLQRALGAPAPRYMHLPLIMGNNGQKLSKQNGAPAIDDSGRIDPVDILNDAARALGLRQPDTRDPQRWLHAATAQWRERFTAAPDSAAR